MSKSLNLKEAERVAYRLSTSRDGLYDTFLGILIILMSLTPWLDENGLRLPWNVILTEGIAFLVLGGVILTKKFLVVPRIGMVRHGEGRKRRLKKLAVIMGIVFLLTVGLFIMTYIATRRGSLLNNHIGCDFELDMVHTGAGIFVFGIFSLIGFMNDYPRMYLYGALFGSGYILSTYLQDQIGILFYWPWAVSGLLVAAIGAVYFIQFLKDFPKPVEPDLGNQA